MMTPAGLLFCLALLFSEPPQFEADILPLLTRQGCNSGACHGAAAGRGGLRLSLFASDPDADHAALVLAHDGRRINNVSAERSLLFRKPTGDLNHGGDERFPPGSDDANLLLDWIRAGTPRDIEYVTQELTVRPAITSVSQLPGDASFQVFVRTRSAGLEEVTHKVTVLSHDPAAVQIIAPGLVQVLRSGQHTVLVRYLDRIIPFTVRSPFGTAGEQATTDDLLSPLDRHVNAVLSEMGLQPQPPAPPDRWLRRVTLDLAGRLPTLREQQAFLATPHHSVRREVVQRLLQEESFADFWTLQLSRVLNLHSLPNDHRVLQTSAEWLRRAISEDRGIDWLMQQIVTATGDSHENGAAGFSRMVPDARSHAELIGSAFAGIRIGCANCHDHPLDRWTQDDFHGLAAVFSRLQRQQHVMLAQRGSVTNVRTGEPAIPRIPGQRYLEDNADHRAAVSDWLLQAPDYLLATNFVNRVWAQLFGRGLVDPVDNLSQTNPSTHPELLRWLAEDFASNGYSLQSLLLQITLSDAYGRSAGPAGTPAAAELFFAARAARPLEPAVFLNAVATVTGVPYDFSEHATNSPLQVIDPLTPAPQLDAIGRCQDPMTCRPADAAPADNLTITLHRLNSGLLNERLQSSDGRLQQRVQAGHTTEEIVAEFVQLALSRSPTETELDHWSRTLSSDDPQQRIHLLEDFVWSLLNSRGFRENH